MIGLLCFAMIRPLLAQPPDTLWTRQTFDIRVHGICCRGQFIHQAGDDNRDIMIQRFRTNGQFDLSASYGTQWGSTISGIVASNSGLPFMTGSFERDFAHDEMLLARMGSNGVGQQIDLSAYGAFRGDQIKRSDAGEMFAIGWGVSASLRSLLIKLDTIGDTLWTYQTTDTFGLPWGDYSPTADGGCLLADIRPQLRLRRISAAGVLEWDSTYMDAPPSGTSLYMTELGNRHVLVYGLDGEPYPLWFFMFDEQGTILNVESHLFGDGEFSVYPNKLFSQGDHIVCTTWSFDEDPLILLDADLNVVWTYSPRQHGLPFSELRAAAFTDEGNLALATMWSEADGYLIMLGSHLATEIPTQPVPSHIQLVAYPNPFNSTATINVAFPQQAEAQLTIFDMLGRAVANLHSGPLSTGDHRFALDGANLPTGSYVVQMQAGETVSTQKLILLK